MYVSILSCRKQHAVVFLSDEVLLAYKDMKCLLYTANSLLYDFFHDIAMSATEHLGRTKSNFVFVVSTFACPYNILPNVFPRRNNMNLTRPSRSSSIKVNDRQFVIPISAKLIPAPHTFIRLVGLATSAL